MPTADADREYYEELRAMGYQVEEAEERFAGSHLPLL